MLEVDLAISIIRYRFKGFSSAVLEHECKVTGFVLHIIKYLLTVNLCTAFSFILVDELSRLITPFNTILVVNRILGSDLKSEVFGISIIICNDRICYFTILGYLGYIDQKLHITNEWFTILYSVIIDLDFFYPVLVIRTPYLLNATARQIPVYMAGKISIM